MFAVTIWSLLTILQLGTSNAGYDKADLDHSLYCDDTALKAVFQKMELLDSANDILRLKLDALDMNNDKQFGEIKDAVKGFAALGKQIAQIHQQKDLKCDCNATRSTTISPPEILDTLPRPIAFPFSSSTPSTTSSLPSSCAEALLRSSSPKNGPQLIHIPNSSVDPFFVYCVVDPRQEGAAWTLIQRRRDGVINFYRNWDEYRRGFGNLEGDFFIGLKRLHVLTQSALHELWIYMEDFDNATRWAKYSSFAVGDESDGYALNMLGAFSGDGGDSLTSHAGQKFSTHDKDNDLHATVNCAVEYTGAWWYTACHASNLNGQYLKGVYPKEMYAKGIDWNSWRGHYYSLKYVHMAIRPLNAVK